MCPCVRKKSKYHIIIVLCSFKWFWTFQETRKLRSVTVQISTHIKVHRILSYYRKPMDFKEFDTFTLNIAQCQSLLFHFLNNTNVHYSRGLNVQQLASWYTNSLPINFLRPPINTKYCIKMPWDISWRLATTFLHIRQF